MAATLLFIGIILGINVLTANSYILVRENQETFINSSNLFEGDIMGIDAKSILSSLQDQNAKNGVADEVLRWKGGRVPYQISSQFNSEQIEVILKAMSGFHNATCIRFSERKNEEDYLLIHSGLSCSSYIGRVGNEQLLSLNPVGCLTYGIIQHELMHALGFVHEQSRTDRDDYVDILWNNIRTRERNNFQKYTDAQVTAFGQGYDFDSLMHYEMNNFAINKSIPTIQPKEQYRHKQIGQRGGLSDVDKKKINLMYKCASHSPNAPYITESESVNVPSVLTPCSGSTASFCAPGFFRIEVELGDFENRLGVRADGTNCDQITDCDSLINVYIDVEKPLAPWPTKTPMDLTTLLVKTNTNSYKVNHTVHKDICGGGLNNVNARVEVMDDDLWGENDLIERFECKFSPSIVERDKSHNWLTKFRQRSDTMECQATQQPTKHRLSFRWKVYPIAVAECGQEGNTPVISTRLTRI